MVFNEMGDLLKNRAKHWSVRYNETTGSWEILDLWSESLAGLTSNSEIPSDSPALKVLSADAFNALVEEADRLGVLARLVGPRPLPEKEAEAFLHPELDMKEQSVEPLEIGKQLEPNAGERYYDYKIQSEAIDAIRQVAVSSNIRSLAKPK